MEIIRQLEHLWSLPDRVQKETTDEACLFKCVKGGLVSSLTRGLSCSFRSVELNEVSSDLSFVLISLSING